MSSRLHMGSARVEKAGVLGIAQGERRGMDRPSVERRAKDGHERGILGSSDPVRHEAMSRRTPRSWWLVLLLVGCSRPNPAYEATVDGSEADASAEGTDTTSETSPTTGADETSAQTAEGTGSTGDEGTTEQPPPGPPLCGVPFEEVAFSDPHRLALNTIGVENDPWVTADRQRIYFARNDGGFRQGMVAQWNPMVGDFTDPLPNPDLIGLTPGEQGKISYQVTDPSIAVLSAALNLDPAYTLWVLDLDETKQLTPPVPLQMTVPGLEPPLYDPHLSYDGQRLYFSDPAQGNQDLFVSWRLDPSSPFTELSALEGANDPMTSDADPTLTADERGMVFTSTRGGDQGLTDLWMTWRASLDDPFIEPILVPNVNSPQADGHSHLSDDGCVLWFSSDRDGFDSDLYVAEVVQG